MELFMLPGMLIVEAIANASPTLRFNPDTDALLAGALSFFVWLMVWQSVMAWVQSKRDKSSGNEKKHSAEAKISRLSNMTGVVAATLSAQPILEHGRPITASIGKSIAASMDIALLAPVIMWVGVAGAIYFVYAYVSEWDHGRRIRKHVKKGAR